MNDWYEIVNQAERLIGLSGGIMQPQIQAPEYSVRPHALKARDRAKEAFVVFQDLVCCFAHCELDVFSKH
jgi:hypothetical protein